jgi:hypothetical protein
VHPGGSLLLLAHNRDVPPLPPLSVAVCMLASLLRLHEESISLFQLHAVLVLSFNNGVVLAATCRPRAFLRVLCDGSAHDLARLPGSKLPATLAHYQDAPAYFAGCLLT